MCSDDLYDFESEREFVSLALNGHLSIDDDSSLRFFSELPKISEPRIKRVDETPLAKKLQLKHRLFLSNQILPSDLPSARFIKKHRQRFQPLKADDLEKSWHNVEKTEKDDLTPKLKNKTTQKSKRQKTIDTKRKIEEFMKETLKKMFKKQR